MELTEGLAFVKPPRRAATIDGCSTLDKLQRRLPKAEGSLVANPPTVQTQKWAMEIWQSGGTQKSYNALREAVQSYNREAGPEHWSRIQEKEASFIDVRDAAFAARDQRAEDAANSNIVVRKVRTGLDKFCSTVHYYCPVVNAMSQAAPQYAQLAWGAIMFLLIMNINAVELKETVLQKLADIGDQFKVIRCFLGLYPSAAMAEHVCGAYEAFTEFLTEAVKYYQENCIKRFFKKITHPYALRFDGIVKQIDDHVVKVREFASLGQGITIAENIAITKQTRAMITMGNWKLDETNQAVTAMVEEARKQTEWQRQAVEDARAERKRHEFDPHEMIKYLLSMRSFDIVLRTVCPTELSVEAGVTASDLSRLAFTNTMKGGANRKYERLGLLENPEIIAWVESRQSKFLWIDGFLARPDWTTQLSLDIITAAREAGDVVLSLMPSEHDANSKLHHPEAWVWNFIDQLVFQRPDYFTTEQQCAILISLLDSRKDSKAVWQVAANCVRDINFGFIYIIIDNIDIALSSGAYTTQLQDLLVGLQHLSQIEHRVVKTFITARHTSFDNIKVPSCMTIVPVTPHAHASKGLAKRKGPLTAARKPKTLIPARLPDRETANDVMLSDDSWDDDKLEEILETTDEEKTKKNPTRKRKPKSNLVKDPPDSDDLDLDSDSSEQLPPTKGAVPINKAKSQEDKAVPKSSADDPSTDSDDSLDSLDSIKSLDSLDEALKTSSDEE